MLATVKREVTNDEQRYGGYKSSNNEMPSFDAQLRRDPNMYDTYAPYSSNTAVKPNPLREEQLWNRLNTNSAPRYVENNEYIYQNNSNSAYQNNSNSATFEPMKLNEDKYNTPVRHRASRQLSTQGKVILAVYLAVVLIIATLIIVNAELINNGTKIDTPTASIENVYEVNESGLTFIESPYNNNEVTTNWFDSLCDKLDK